MGRYLNKLVRTLERNKRHNDTQSKQRRGGVTDLYALDYQGEIINTGIWGYGHNGLVSGSSGSNSATVVSDEKVGNTTERITALVKAIKANVPEATAIGISGVVGCFGLESDVTARRYEADYATDYQYDKMRKEPTAENLMGSWGGFLSLYGGSGLNQAGYQAGGKHYIGIGLGQWTGPRCLKLWEFAGAEGKDIFSFELQVKFMVEKEEALSEKFKEIVKLETSVEDSTTRFLAEWEGVPGNKLAQRIQYANDHFNLVETVLKGEYDENISLSPHVGDGSGTSSPVSGGRTFDAKVEKVIAWFEERVGKVTYSMSARTGPNSYDCSSAVYYAMKSAGYDPLPGWAFSTETMHDVIKKHGWKLVKEQDSPHGLVLQRGDIIIWGKQGYSAGAGGHVLIALNANEVIHCSISNNGIAVDNYNNYSQNLSYYTYLYRPDSLLSASTNAGSLVQRVSSTYRVLVPADLDRFQRWFVKVLVTNNVGDTNNNKVIPLAGATLTIQATNQRTGSTINRDVSEILRSLHPCDWIGSSTDDDAVYPNEEPLEGYDIMYLAWYLSEEERDALYSAGEKLFTISALGNAKVTLRNFLKFSHIN